MSTAIYDRALLEKISRWTSTTKMTVLGVNDTTRLFEYMGDVENDSPATLPMITISRNRSFTIVNGGTTKRMLSYEGPSIGREVKNKGTPQAYGVTKTVAAIPISIPYQLDIYTRFAEEADIIVRNLIFNIINFPSLEVTVPSTDLDIIGRIVLNDTIEDNSDIPERFIAGNFTRLSLTITIDDAQLFDVRELHDVAIDLIIDDTSEPWKWSEDGTKLDFPDLSDRDHISIPDPVTLD